MGLEVGIYRGIGRRDRANGQKYPDRGRERERERGGGGRSAVKAEAAAQRHGARIRNVNAGLNYTVSTRV